MEKALPYIVGIGVASAAAPDLRGTLDALQSRRTLFTKATSFIGPDFKPLVCAFRDPDLVSPLRDRFAELLVESLDDLSANEAAPQPSVLILCLPERTAGEATEDLLTQPFVESLAELVSSRFVANGSPPPTHVYVSSEGSPGPVQALRALGAQPDNTDVILCAVDSYACRDRLGHLLSADRLFSNSTPWGLVPGEGAVAFRLRYAARGNPGLALSGLAHENEVAGEMDGQDSAFEALSTCLQSSASSMAVPASVLTTGWNNSRYRASEFSYALHRLPDSAVQDEFELRHPALRFGELGACSLAMATAIALADGMVAGLHCAGATWGPLRASWATVEFPG